MYWPHRIDANSREGGEAALNVIGRVDSTKLAEIAVLVVAQIRGLAPEDVVGHGSVADKEG